MVISPGLVFGLCAYPCFENYWHLCVFSTEKRVENSFGNLEKTFSTSKKYFLWKKETEKCWATKANEQFSSMASSSATLYHLPLLSRLTFLKVKEMLLFGNLHPSILGHCTEWLGRSNTYSTYKEERKEAALSASSFYFFCSANEHSCAYGAQINFGDLSPYLTYGGSASVEVYRRSCALQCAYVKCLIYYHIYGTVQQRQILKVHKHEIFLNFFFT